MPCSNCKATCEVPKPKTCSETCIPGCSCKEGFVLDDILNKYVLPIDCPSDNTPTESNDTPTIPEISTTASSNTESDTPETNTPTDLTITNENTILLRV